MQEIRGQGLYSPEPGELMRREKRVHLPRQDIAGEIGQPITLPLRTQQTRVSVETEPVWWAVAHPSQKTLHKGRMIGRHDQGRWDIPWHDGLEGVITDNQCWPALIIQGLLKSAPGEPDLCTLPAQRRSLINAFKKAIP